MVPASNPYRRVTECWDRLGRWPRRVLLTVGVLAALVWLAIGSLVLLAVSDSPLHCPPTMGCPDRETKDCSSWGGLLESATTTSGCAEAAGERASEPHSGGG
jgi:hypothetical protein